MMSVHELKILNSIIDSVAAQQKQINKIIVLLEKQNAVLQKLILNHSELF